MMLPLVMDLRVRTDVGHRIRLWLPLFLLWLLALPLLILLLPFYVVACFVMRVNPLSGIRAFWNLLSAVRGTHIEVDNARTFVFMHVY